MKLIARKITRYFFWQFQKIVLTRIRLMQNKKVPERRLEIGPGPRRIQDFETLNIMGGRQVDYVRDAAKNLPFDDNTFAVIYAGHVLEHIPWYQTVDAVKEWVRVLRPGGCLEIWVPDGLKICMTLVDYESTGKNAIGKDGWLRFNPEKEPCKWAAGRIFAYGDGTGSLCHPNWHRALFTSRYLQKVMEQAGLREVRRMNQSEIRGDDHGWINLGMTGIKT